MIIFMPNQNNLQQMLISMSDIEIQINTGRFWVRSYQLIFTAVQHLSWSQGSPREPARRILTIHHAQLKRVIIYFMVP